MPGRMVGLLRVIQLVAQIAIALATMGLIGVSSCGSGSKVEPGSEVPAAAPVGLLVEHEISGEILGQSLRNPRGVAVDRRGMLYLLDTGNSRLIRFNEKLKPDKEVGGFGNLGGLFDHPEFLVVENELNLLVSDGGNRRVCRYNPRLEYVESIEFQSADDPLGFGHPSGVNVTTYGEVWVADRTNNRIVVYDNIGRFDRFVGDFGYRGGQLQEPAEIIRMSRNRFLVCDAGNKRAVVYDQFGNYDGEVEFNSLGYPIAAAAERSTRRERYWLIDAETQLIHAIDGKKRVVFTAGPLLTGTARALNEPADICIAQDGRLVISDAGNNRVLICRILDAEPSTSSPESPTQ